MPTKKKQFIKGKERFEVLLEEIQSEVHIIAEQSVAHTEKLEIMDGRMDRMDGRMDKMDGRMDRMENDISVIKLDIEFIKNDLKQKVNRDEFAALERRLSLLENKVGAAI